jgi:hypothetical protein
VLNFVLAAGMMLIVIASIIGFLVWVAREHLTARKYRNLIRLHDQMKLQAPAHISNVGPRWEVAFKDGRKNKVVTVSGDTEIEAMRNFTKVHTFSKIDSVTKKS